ncbi:MAG: SpoIID/LytB domain-containing protein [Acidobacteriota bacterium]
MPKLSGTARLRLSVALALVLLASGFADSVLLTASAAQNSAASSKTKNSVSEETSRPRSVTANEKRPAEPVVRIALMTDQTSVSLSSDSGLVVSRSSPGARDDRIANGLLGAQASLPAAIRIELREPSRAAASRAPAYRIAVESTDDLRHARKLAGELTSKFGEQAAVAFDSKEKEYDVVIGRFEEQAGANPLLARLRRSGYADARIVKETNEPESLGKDSNSKQAKAKSQSDKDDRSTSKSARTTQIAAVESGKLIAANDERLIVFAAKASSDRFDRADREPKKPGNDEPESDERREPNSRANTTDKPLAVRVGDKEYRGEIHLVMNRRGRINVINAVSMEDYLRGVVPMELSPGQYPAIEALKAQAIAARTYALANQDQHGDEGFDLYDDARSQVYAGLTCERELSNRAVEETRGMIAVVVDEAGHASPIQALYTANCGGSTENNEAVFGGAPLPYLRGVACAPDRATVAERDIATSRIADRSVDNEDRPILRSAALLEVLGFQLPQRLTSSYLRSSPDQAEVTRWIERAARLTQKDKPSFGRGDATRLPGFARLVAAAVYGEGRASLLLPPADVDYLLGGLGGESLPRESRADVAMLLKDGVLAAPSLDTRTPLTRAQIIETLARALSLKPQVPNLRSQISDLRFATAQPSDSGRVLIASTALARSEPRAKEQRAADNTAMQTNRLPPSKSGTRSSELTTREISARQSPHATSSQPKSISQTDGFEVEDNAWLFRSMGGESYAVDRVALIGGERIIYHLNTRGRIDFLEATPSERGASSDRFSSIAQWNVRLTRDEMERRLARSRVNVGKLESIEPVAFSTSHRVTEVEVTGDEGHARLRGRQIIGALGLRENLFVVDAEKDSRGEVTAFVFTGRGWGHGVGLCQTGAFGLAKEGYSYTAILQKYYTDVKIQKAY